MQQAPLQDFDFVDLNGDGSPEVLTVGNLYNVEVETQRYDASKGTVLEYKDGSFYVISAKQTGFITTGDSRKIVTIKSKNQTVLVVTNNNGPLDVFTK